MVPFVLPHDLFILRLYDPNEIGALGGIGFDADCQQLTLELSIGRAEGAHQRLELIEAR